MVIHPFFLFKPPSNSHQCGSNCDGASNLQQCWSSQIHQTSRLKRIDDVGQALMELSCSLPPLLEDIAVRFGYDERSFGVVMDFAAFPQLLYHSLETLKYKDLQHQSIKSQ